MILYETKKYKNHEVNNIESGSKSLYIGVNLDEEVKEFLLQTIAELRNEAQEGRYISKKNLYLKLVNIGDTDRVDDVLDIMKAAVEDSFSGTMGGIDIILSDLSALKQSFGGKIDVSCVREYPYKDSVSRQMIRPNFEILLENLEKGLASAGFDTSEMDFYPHVTIAYDVCTAPESFRNMGIAKLKKFYVDKISLFRLNIVRDREIRTEIGGVHHIFTLAT